MRAFLMLVCSLSALWLGNCSVRSVQTDIAGSRFSAQADLPWKKSGIVEGGSVLYVNRSSLHQSILGFGSAFTETAAFNYHALQPDSRAKLVTALWGPPPFGNGYTMGRIHMGSADYSLSSYSLDESEDDFELNHFDDNLTRDSHYVLPLLRAALEAVGDSSDLRIFFSPWSPPGWLKKNGAMIDTVYPNGLLPGDKARNTYAQYFVRFARALSAAGVPAWGATLQNEPLVDMTSTKHVYESCAWTADEQGQFLAALGAALAADPDPKLRDLKLFGYDWNRAGMSNWTKVLLTGPGAKYLAGVSHHWYAWKKSLELADIESLPAGTLSFGAEASLIKKGVVMSSLRQGNQTSSWGILLDTEAAQAGKAILPNFNSVRYTFAVGELYLLDILGTLQAGSSAWVDWNAFLNYTGGPNHINRNDIGAPVLIDAATDSIFLQSPHYYMGHMSRYVRPGARRVACGGHGMAETPEEYDAVKDYISPQVEEGGMSPAGSVPLVAGCFVDASQVSVSIVVMNAGSVDRDFTLVDEPLGSVSVRLDAHSVRTFTYSVPSKIMFV